MKVGRNNIDRKVVSLKDFRGVDYASSPLEVKPYRATDMANLLLRDGQLQKRYGFKQLVKANVKVETDVSFYEKWSVLAFKCGKYVILQYYDNVDNESWFTSYEKDSNGMIIEKSWYRHPSATPAVGVNINKKLYLFCGGEIISTDGETWETVNAYIPTTTTNIPLVTAINAGTEGSVSVEFKADVDVAYPNTSVESANLLTKTVRNKLLVKSVLNEYEETKFFKFRYFKLDGKIDEITTNNSGVALQSPPKIEGYEDIIFTVTDASQVFYDESIPSEDMNYEGRKCWYSGAIGVAIATDRSMCFPKQAVNYYLTENYSIFVVVDEAKFQAFLNQVQETVAGAKSVTEEYKIISFVYENVNLGDTKNSITSCTCATIFGVDGANDRVFVGGGDEPNIVYFSENDIDYNPNPAYFPVDSFLVCGVGNAKVSGFLRASDGTLAIFKDVTDSEEVSVYYTSGYYESTGVGAEGNEYQRAKFTVKAGDIRRTGISAKSVANLEGDNIFTCNEGVYGIQLSDNVASGERYARERSRTINPKITQFPLANAKSIVYKDKYFLAVGNGEVYVADARYKFTLQGDQQNTFNYEWFRLTGLNVLEWFIFEDKLHFIDKDGYFCEFTEGFADQYLVSTDNNELSVAENGTVIFNKEERLPLIKASSYAIDGAGNTWELTLTEDENALIIPKGITIADADDLDLWFCVPVAAYWQSAVMDLNSPMYLKNMWSLSMVASAKHGGKINLGYKTRMNAVSSIEVEGANASTWGQAIDLFGGVQTSMLTGGAKSFGMYTFDVGGYVGINTYTRRIFDRNFAHIQLLFTSETTTDCAVSEMDIEYSIAKKNIGVG